MSGLHSRKARQGVAHRAKIRELIVPKMYVGCCVPSANFIAKILGTDSSGADKQMLRVMAEDGIKFEIQAVGPTGRRRIVTAIR